MAAKHIGMVKSLTGPLPFFSAVRPQTGGSFTARPGDSGVPVGSGFLVSSEAATYHHQTHNLLPHVRRELSSIFRSLSGQYLGAA